ncbi:hypothetical protein [Herbaspirillum sp. RV1423]|uniref:hypothetical protein n=1 Tax=Herbaspirillum sp. RV1423 TaxID=1443993 RepID=UPI0004BA2DE7|nr:hypothetical protein [Herbaspirillum sp. RV1423]
MQFIIETVPSDIALMFIIYLGFCLLLMYLFIRADCEWNKREMKMSREHLHAPSSEQDAAERLPELTACSARQEIDCSSCLLNGHNAEGQGKDKA